MYWSEKGGNEGRDLHPVGPLTAPVQSLAVVVETARSRFSVSPAASPLQRRGSKQVCSQGPPHEGLYKLPAPTGFLSAWIFTRSRDAKEEWVSSQCHLLHNSMIILPRMQCWHTLLPRQGSGFLQSWVWGKKWRCKRDTAECFLCEDYTNSQFFKGSPTRPPVNIEPQGTFCPSAILVWLLACGHFSGDLFLISRGLLSVSWYDLKIPLSKSWRLLQGLWIQ